jgi:hypothetical protein
MVSNEGKLLDPKKIQANINMLIQTTLTYIYVFNGMTQFY